MTTRLAAVATLCTLLLSLAACGDKTDDRAPKADPSEPVSSDEPTPGATESEPVEAEDPNTTMQFTWTDADGYKRRVTFTGLRVGVTDTNTVDQRPGEAQVSLVVAGDAVVENLTPGRNASTGLSGAQIGPLYPSSSPVCDGMGDLVGVGRELDPVVREVGPDQFESMEFCQHRGAEDSSDPPISDTIPIGGSVSLVFEQSYQPVIAEADLDEYVADLTDPEFWGLYRPAVPLDSLHISQTCYRGGYGLTGGDPTGYDAYVATSSEGKSWCPQLSEQ